MYIYIDESGSINNKLGQYPFVIALIYVHDHEKDNLKRAYKRFVSSNHDTLLKLDTAKKPHQKQGGTSKSRGKMFLDGKFHELKGSQFDRPMKLKFVDFFSRKQYFELFYIKLDNKKASNSFCENPTRAFNYLIRLALGYFIKKGYLPSEDCYLQLDERNQNSESKYFLEEYLNTELVTSGDFDIKFSTEYFDSSNNNIIQISDVFSNLYYSHLVTGAYTDTIKVLQDRGILKKIFEFPRS